ncbi:hypothetical protein O3P69_019174 [Scylla paramamosain]|uniref:Centromere protein S n=1 Tax=Scylla paramamosain TaxID=85552 RepID=A0AAW0SV49_SCYPA
MAEEARKEDDAGHKQTLKASLHYTIGKICSEVSAGCDLTLSKQVMAVLTEVASRQLTLYAGDLEAYASHGKRTVINSDDIKLLVRRNLYLARHIGEMVEKMEEGRKKRGRKRKKPAEGKEEEEEEEEEEERKEEEKND